MHPGPGHATGTLVNALIAHCGASLSGIGGVRRPGIVHRLDKDTTGLLVVAKTRSGAPGAGRAVRRARRRRPARARLPGARVGRAGAAARRRSTRRSRRSTANRTKIAVVRGERGRRAVTHYEVLETLPNGERKPVASLLRLDARDRPHAPGARAPRPYRPSAAGRHDLRRRLQGERAQARPRRRRRRWRRSAGRRCTPRSSRSCTP